jgi:hypothetical protein
LCFFFLVFFSDKGLLAVAELISPDAMYKVVINLDNRLIVRLFFFSKRDPPYTHYTLWTVLHSLQTSDHVGFHADT